MNISRFFGTTNREAMRQVRLALGPDALIISNRRVDGGVEILAADPTALEGIENAAAGAAPAPSAAPAAPSTVTPTVTPSTDGPVSGVNRGAVPLRSEGVAPTAAKHPTLSQPVQPQPSQPQSSQPLPPPMSRMSPMAAYAAAVEAAYGSTAVPGSTTTSGKQAAPAVPAVPSASGITAAPGATSEPPARAATPIARAAQVAAGPATAAAAAQAPPAAAGYLGLEGGADSPDIMDAIGAMRGALESRIDELLWGNQLRRAPQAANLFQTLMGFGFSTALLRAMLKRLPDQLSSRASLQWVRDELVSHLPVPASEDDLWHPGLVLALVGPTGVGKTTTIAKLAARCVRRFGPDKLVLITTDTYRIGAHEQLKIYGQMLRVPVHVVRNAQELREVVQGVRPDQVILIDNVGISQRDRYVGEQAAMLAAAGRDVTRLLVLNAASHGETLDEVARTYAADGGTPLKGCIITKVDEASRLGAALDTALRYRLPIHYVSIGQKVPEHLVFLSPAELIDRALTHLPTTRTLYAPTEADFAALMSMTRDPADDSTGAADMRRQHMQALPRLLSMAAGAGDRLTVEDLREGCEFIDDLTCTSEAYDLWRSLTAGTERAELDAWVRLMLRVAQNAWSESGHSRLLAVHDQVALRANGDSPAQLRATVMLDQHGVPLSTPLQQLTLPTGWLSSCGETLAQAPGARTAMLHQIDWLQQQAADLPVLHLLEGGGPALWRDLAERQLQWMAQVPAITRVHLEDGATTVQALAKTLAHHPVADPDYLFAFTEVQGGPAAEHSLWAASTPVTIVSRGSEPLALQMISVRLLDRASGKVLRTVIGLHPSLDVPVEKLAAWLVVKAESRDALRHAASAWALLSAEAGHSALQHKALASVQVGLAAWQLRKSPLAERGRQVASAMLGKKALQTAAAAPGLLKLFALKEMMGA